MVRDQFGDGRKDPSYVYRLAIRSRVPISACWPIRNPPRPQQQQNQTPLASASVPQGRDGGDSARRAAARRIRPARSRSRRRAAAGVTCPGAVLGGDVDAGLLVLVAAEDAAAWAGPIKIVGKAKIGDREVVREARYAVVVWGTPNRQQQPAEFRLAARLQLGVIDKDIEPALVPIGEDKVWETRSAARSRFRSRSPAAANFKDPVKLTAVGLPQQMRPKEVTLDGNKATEKFELRLNQRHQKPGATRSI